LAQAFGTFSTIGEQYAAEAGLEAALADLPATETNELIQERIVQVYQAARGRCVFPAAESRLRAKRLSQFLIGDDSQRPLEGLKPRNMPKIRQFAVEMALGGRSSDIWNGIPLSALRAWKASQNAAFHIPAAKAAASSKLTKCKNQPKR